MSDRYCVVQTKGSLHICLLDTHSSNGETLQFSTREMFDVAIKNLSKVWKRLVKSSR